MRNYLKTVRTNTQTILDSTTGEMIDVQTKTVEILTNNKENFIQLYTSFEAKQLQLSLSEERLFFYCIYNSNNDNIIRLTIYDKKIIANKWGIASSYPSV